MVSSLACSPCHVKLSLHSKVLSSSDGMYWYFMCIRGLIMVSRLACSPCQVKFAYILRVLKSSGWM